MAKTNERQSPPHLLHSGVVQNVQPNKLSKEETAEDFGHDLAYRN
jgi:hypothetical protein